METERLVLREWRSADLDAFAAINGDPQVRRYMYPPRALTPLESAGEIGALTDHWERIGFGHWAVEERATGELIGRIGAKRHPDWPLDPENSEIGWLLRRSAWGRGYATEGARAVVQFLRERIGQQEIISIAHPANAASHRVMEKAGLERAGELRWEARGIDVVWYSSRGSAP